MLLLLLSATAHHQSATIMSLGLQEGNVLPATPRVSGTGTETNSTDQDRSSTDLCCADGIKEGLSVNPNVAFSSTS